MVNLLGFLKIFHRVAFSGVAVYMLLVRPWFLKWGTVGDEVRVPLPGDQLVPDARNVSTRALTINAPTECVWPWLAQLGQGRGGLYSYDWLENLAQCDIHSADKILPEFQNLKVGDKVRLVPEDYPAPLFLEVAEIDPERVLVLRSLTDLAENKVEGFPTASWSFVLQPLEPNMTRLIVRWRSDFAPTITGYFWNKYGIEPIHFMMERKMLLGIKARAEETARREYAFTGHLGGEPNESVTYWGG